ncbi:MAG TPA: hypothetical protein VHW25_02630 [Steroidobacteraceae bacterium]|jgi:hypothetical protein|nr:hypothetical protein [Steroidobacteraceae bacterium]
MSQQERVSWVSLVVIAFISVWYFAYVLSLPGDSHLFGPGMAVFALNLIITAIFAGIASEVILRWVQKRAGGDPRRRERPDERDRFIALRAGRNAYVVLFASVAIVLGLIPMIQFMRSIPMRAGPALRDTVLMRMLAGPLDPPLLAQWLLLALVLADVCKYVTRIVSYRRGY